MEELTNAKTFGQESLFSQTLPLKLLGAAGIFSIFWIESYSSFQKANNR